MSAFSYKPLAASEIRLLHLQPGKYCDTIACVLSHHSLDEPKYDALSYVWGDPSVRFDILINGYPFTVGRNLYYALKYLRSEEIEIVLWADAICINQNDTDEKNTQVPMMADIYRTAHNVRCWVGRSFEDDDREGKPMEAFEESARCADRDTGETSPENYLMSAAFYVLEKFSSNDTFDIWQPGRYHIREDAPPVLQEAMTTAVRRSFDDANIVKCWRELQRIFERPYWRRVWIQQEVICADNAVLHCGSHSKNLIPLGRVGTAIQRCAQRYVNRSLPDALADIHGASRSMLSTCQHATNWGVQLSPRRGLYTQPGVILNFLRSQYAFAATNLLDKFYGISGLIEPWSDGKLFVSYNRPIREVSCEAIRLLLQYCGVKGMQIFCTMFQIPQAARIDLPSWCPDVSYVSATGSLDAERKSTSVTTSSDRDLPQRLYWPSAGDLSNGVDFSAAGASMPNLRFSGCGLKMICSGVILDINVTCSPDLTTPQLMDMRCITQPVQIFRGNESRKWTTDSHEEMWRTLCADYAWGSEGPGVFASKAPESYGKVFDFLCTKAAEDIFLDGEYAQSLDLWSIARKLPGAEELPRETSGQDVKKWILGTIGPFRRAVLTATRKRRFMVSSKDYTGLVSLDAQEGDFVCIIFGCPMPLIMRPVEDHFVFIGEAYIHRWMHGEAMEALKTGELEETMFEIW